MHYMGDKIDSIDYRKCIRNVARCISSWERLILLVVIYDKKSDVDITNIDHDILIYIL